MSDLALIFDTETHDTKEPEIIEAAWMRVEFGNPTQSCEHKEGRFKPSKPIALGAMATHHIMDEDLIDCDPSGSFELPLCEYIIGHNVDFDWEAAGKPDCKRICTLALARSLWPQLDSHNQSAVLYHIDRANARKRLQNAHSAGSDVYTCQTILDAIIRQSGATSWQHLWNFSETARIPTVMTFGKWKGTLIAEVPHDYKAWLLRQADVDQYLRIALTKKPSTEKSAPEPQFDLD